MRARLSAALAACIGSLAETETGRGRFIELRLTGENSGYILAVTPFVIVLAPEAVDDFRSLRANERAEVRAAMETHLRHEPGKVSRSRIKRLRGLRQPQYRLRVGDVRVFYDVSGATVEVLAIVTKGDADAWLGRHGNRE